MHHAARSLTVLFACFAASIGIASAGGDSSVPICSGAPIRLPTPQVNGTATEMLPQDTGIDSVTLAGGAINLSLNVDAFASGASQVTFTVTQTIGGADASGAVVVQDIEGLTCTLAVQFVNLSPGPVSGAVLCSGQGNSVAVTNAASQPGGTSVCTSVVLPSAEPGLPPGFRHSPATDLSGCRSLTVNAPISGTTDMEITKVGTFDPNLRFMFSKFDGMSFPAFIELPTTVEAGSTKVKATGGWSLVKMACAELAPQPVPAIFPWGMLLLVILVLSSATWLLSRRARPQRP